MAKNYIIADEKDFSGGIDARSAENQIDKGFVKDLLNASILEKRVRKRAGYQGYAGNLPVRVASMEYVDGSDLVYFNLDQSIDLSNSHSTPIVVYGRSSTFSNNGGSADDGPFVKESDSVKYYPGFSIPTRKLITAPSGTLTVAGTEHNLGTTNLFVGTVESTSLTVRDYSTIVPNTVTIDETSFDIAIGYTTYIDRNLYVYYADKTPSVGSSYVHTYSHPGGGSASVSIPSATHGLANFNIIGSIQQDLGSSRQFVEPEQFLISNIGDVTVTLNSASATTFYVILSAAPVSNIVAGNIASGTTADITIPNLTTPWVFPAIYLEQTPGGDKELVLPEAIAYSEANNEITVTFVNSGPTPTNFTIFYEYGIIRANQIAVSDSTVTTTGTDLAPQITIWGLDHSEIYTDTSERQGWVSHLDSYRRSGEQRLVSGLGGNLFNAETYSEAGSTYAYPLLYPNLQGRIDSTIIAGPLLWDTADTPARTRGYITGNSSGTGWASVTAVAYDSGNGWTKYTLSIPAKAILDSTGTPTTLGSVISTTSNLEDWLTVESMSYALHEGTFRIRQVLDGVDQVQIWVENSTNSSDYDDAGTGGQAGVFTDQLTTTANSQFIGGDTLVSVVFGDTFVCQVLSSVDATTVADGFVDRIEIAAGVSMTASRTSSVVPLRQPAPFYTASTTNVVAGDMFSYPGIDRLLRVLQVNPDSNRSVDITSDGTTATITLLSGNTDYLQEGQNILLTQAGAYTGVITLSAIASSSTLEFLSSETVSVSGATLVGETVQLDEELSWQDTIGDTNFFRCEARWIPIEAPDDSYNLTPSTHVRYLDSGSYSDQSFLRSTMVVDNMYLTNNADEVYKFDGSNAYRAGLIPWQPGLFLIQDTGATAKIIADNPASTPTAVPDNVFTVPIGDQVKFPAGSRIRHSFTGGFTDYTVLDAYDNGTNGFVKVRRIVTTAIVIGTSPVLTLLSTLRYYFRLNAVDGNNNVVASAVTGSQDHVVELAADAAVRIRLVGLPAWDVYDYDRLEVEIYRTLINTPAPFYKVTTVAMEFDSDNGYIDYVDSFADTDLTELDNTVSVLKGGNTLGTRWSDPLRAKYITSIGNRLVLANVKDYPALDIQIIADGTATDTTYSGSGFLFRRDNVSTSTATDMVDSAWYIWKKTSTAKSISSVTGVASTSFTVTTSTTHGLSVGNWVYLFHSVVPTTGETLLYSGWWQVASVGSTSAFTVNFDRAEGSPAGYPDKCLISTTPTDIPVPLGTDGNMGMVNGDSFDTFDAMRRMSMAINATMRKVDTSITGYGDFVPWMVARGGNDLTPAGRLIVSQPRSDTVTMEVMVSFSGFDLFVNSVRRATSDQISASTRLYPSRVLVSYENYPEIFDNPTSIIDSESDSAIDINSADGQEITGVVPFFGEAAFGAAQQSAILVVFKTNSIYLVDINEKRAGRNPVQRIETEGLGCTAPYSIAVTKNGIIFANESGIYCLRRSQAIEYIGRYMERNWLEEVDRDMLNIVQGHHYAIGRQYKLSVPLVDSSVNSEVYVYDHTAEVAGRLGAWSRFDNHPATGWANLNQDAFFASSNGRVFSIRRTGSETDFRDDNESINMELVTRANDFGNSGIRKVIDKIVVHYRVGARNTGTSVSTAVDLEQEYRSTTPFVVPKPAATTGIGDSIAQDVTTISHSTDRRRGVYFQVKVANDTIDENVEVAGIDHQVGGLKEKGILRAAQTK